MRSRLSTRSIGGAVGREAVLVLVVVEISFGAEPAAEVDAPAVEEKGPPAPLPSTVMRRLVNLETFIILFVVVVFLIFELHLPFVSEAGGG